MNYILPSRLVKYEEIYDTQTKGAALRQIDREKVLQSLMRTNLLKRLESSVESFRITLGHLEQKVKSKLDKINLYEKNGGSVQAIEFDELDAELIDEDEEFEINNANTEGKVKIDFADMDLISWRRDLEEDQTLIVMLLEEMNKISPEDDFKLQHLQELKNKINKTQGINVPKEKSGEEKTKKPNDLIDLCKAIELYHRSRAQIKRDIKDDKINDYRKIKKGKHWISKKEADNLYIIK